MPYPRQLPLDVRVGMKIDRFIHWLKSWRKPRKPVENDNGYFEIDTAPGGMTLIPAMGSPEFDRFVEAMRKEREGIKPPTDTAADGWTWAAWSKEMAALAFPGWAPCRFATRTTEAMWEPEKAVFVFGITRGPFGIWEKSFDVCRFDDEGAHTKVSENLFTLTHLPTGHGVGVFAFKDAAALAADTAVRACPQWDEELIAPELMDRTLDCWRMVGITRSATEHAHMNGEPRPLSIMALSHLEDGKPERLS